MSSKRVAASVAAEDPFGERVTCTARMRAQILGGLFEFVSNDRRLIGLVRVAYGRLPSHGFTRRPPRLNVELRLTSGPGPAFAGDPPALAMHTGAGILCGVMNAANFALVAPAERKALVVLSEDMLEHAYHARYELIEFAVYLLATRTQGLVGLHAGAIGRGGRALLLIGESGAGKSTLCLHAAASGFDFIAEDSVLVRPSGLLATGIGSFLHLREDSLGLVPAMRNTEGVRASQVIRRRSGVRKLEIDMRSHCRIAARPLPLAGIVFMSAAAPEGGRLLAPLKAKEALARLRATQPYAANQPGWADFATRVRALPSFELRRAGPPSGAVEALGEILDRSG